jgi:hypothetical protein
MELLFERFLSESRGEWPDIDLDPPSEDKREQAIYSFFDRIDKAHEDEANAIADAVSYMFENPNPSQLTPAQIDKEIDLTKPSPLQTSPLRLPHAEFGRRVRTVQARPQPRRTKPHAQPASIKSVI